MSVTGPVSKVSSPCSLYLVSFRAPKRAFELPAPDGTFPRCAIAFQCQPNVPVCPSLILFLFSLYERPDDGGDHGDAGDDPGEKRRPGRMERRHHEFLLLEVKQEFPSQKDRAIHPEPEGTLRRYGSRLRHLRLVGRKWSPRCRFGIEVTGEEHLREQMSLDPGMQAKPELALQEPAAMMTWKETETRLVSSETVHAGGKHSPIPERCVELQEQGPKFCQYATPSSRMRV